MHHDLVHTCIRKVHSKGDSVGLPALVTP